LWGPHQNSQKIGACGAHNHNFSFDISAMPHLFWQ